MRAGCEQMSHHIHAAVHARVVEGHSTIELLESKLVDIHAEDDINERNCLHEAAISGRLFVFQ
jgi:hypothetical protein